MKDSPLLDETGSVRLSRRKRLLDENKPVWMRPTDLGEAVERLKPDRGGQIVGVAAQDASVCEHGDAPIRVCLFDRSRRAANVLAWCRGHAPGDGREDASAASE